MVCFFARIYEAGQRIPSLLSAAQTGALTTGDDTMLQLKEICFYNVGFAHPDFLAAQFAGHGILNGTLNGKDQVIGTRLTPLQLLAASIDSTI